MGPEIPRRFRVTARNAASDSENRIHEDSVARAHGFGGGLVPGVSLYAYMTHPVVERCGRPWLERGRISARFHSPVYDGQLVEVRASDADGSGVGGAGRDEGPDGAELALVLTNPDGIECVTGHAGVPSRAAPDGSYGPSVAEIPVAEVPRHRPAADEESLAPGRVLGTVWDEGDRGRYGAYLALLEGDLPIYESEGVVHPGRLILAANTVLVANVALGPWIHVGSDVTNLAAVPAGSVVETRARVAERFERKGHQFVVLDVVWMVEERPVMTARHTAIYQLRT